MTRYSYRSPSARRKQLQAIRKRNKRITWAITVFFIVANIILGIIMWPKVIKYRKDVQSGKIDPILKIEIRKD